MEAIIDLGSNTFHLLVGAMDKDGKINIVHKDRRFVHLAEHGVDIISPEIMERALDAILAFRQYCDLQGVQKIWAYGTETLRKAANSEVLINRIKEQVGIEITIIDGHQEAGFIAQGVELVAGQKMKEALVVDIGGGSTEFILIQNEHRPYRSFSYPVGSSVMYQKFQKSEPMTYKEGESLFGYLDEALFDVVNHVKTHHIRSLIGASGTFEVLRNAVMNDCFNEHFCALDMEASQSFMRETIGMTLGEREADPRIPENRAKLMSTAFSLILWMMKRFDLSEIYYSDYAMKEGILRRVCNTEYKIPI